MNLMELSDEITRAMKIYGEDILFKEIYLVCHTDDKNTVIGELTDVNVYTREDGGYGLDFSSECDKV